MDQSAAGAYDAPARCGGRHSRVPTVARSTTRRPWPRLKVRARRSSTIARKTASQRTRWRGSRCDRQRRHHDGRRRSPSGQRSTSYATRSKAAGCLRDCRSRRTPPSCMNAPRGILRCCCVAPELAQTGRRGRPRAPAVARRSLSAQQTALRSGPLGAGATPPLPLRWRPTSLIRHGVFVPTSTAPVRLASWPYRGRYPPSPRFRPEAG